MQTPSSKDLSTLMVQSQGSCDPEFSTVRSVFEENFTRCEELGASVCIYLDGRRIVHLWGGHTDAARTRPWQRDTLGCVASTAKGMATLCLLRLIDRDQVDVDAPVCRYWPEFAAAGKVSITVRWLMSHRAGLPAVRHDMTTESMYRWHPFVQALAEEAPWWQPGIRHGYHALTFGFVLGEIVRRVSGKSIGRFFRDEIGAPLNADFYFGVPESEDARAAEMLPEPLPAGADQSFFLDLLRDQQSMGARAFLNPPRPPQSMNTRAWGAAEIPASNGYATAAGVARVYAALACDGSLHGVHVLERTTIAAAATEQACGPDAVIPAVSRFGLGF